MFDVRRADLECARELDGQGSLVFSENNPESFESVLSCSAAKNGPNPSRISGRDSLAEGTAYLADLKLAENVTLDAVSLSLRGAPALTVEARAFGGYVYADWTRDGGPEMKAAINAVNLSLAEAGEFAAVRDEMEGRIGLAKLTFNGDPRQWMSGQMSVRLEAGDFAWRKNAVENLTVGLSVAGRRVRVNEFVLRQKANRVKLRGTASLPSMLPAWQEMPIEGCGGRGEMTCARWPGCSALRGPRCRGMTVEGVASGRAGDGEAG